MQIEYLGHSAFKIKGQNATVVTDPFCDGTEGLKFPKVAADIVTISHDHEAHNNVKGVEGKDIKFVVNGPGEYEIANVNIIGTDTYHDNKEGVEGGRNTIYLIEIDDYILCHLGALGHKLTSEQVEEVDGVDILFIPVGGVNSFNIKTAVEVINQMEPLVVIPMHYGEDELKKFIQELGVENAKFEKIFSIKKSNLPQEMEVVVLTHTA